MLKDQELNKVTKDESLPLYVDESDESDDNNKEQDNGKTFSIFGGYYKNDKYYNVHGQIVSDRNKVGSSLDPHQNEECLQKN